MDTQIRVGPAAFDMAQEYQWLAGCPEDGAVVTFTGKVRNHNLGDDVAA
ncbi:molybdenum cofactor biosynthesis protein MoaE, partial [Pantoea ananatis]